MTPSSTANTIDGMWASTGIPQTSSGPIGDRAPFLDLRNVVDHNPAMNSQSIRAVKLQSGQTAVVVGCPGGRVRVIQPGTMRTGGTPHTLGSVESSDDFGFGGAGLAVRHETVGGEKIRIWFGTLYDPVKRAAAYANPLGYNNPAGALADDELAVGAVHRMSWTPGVGFSTAQTLRLEPGAQIPGGAYGVVGLHLADLLQQAPGDELIVATMSGDLVVLNADTMQVLWQTHVPGAIGFYNSMVVADLDSNGKNELYVAGSRGLWRFVET